MSTTAIKVLTVGPAIGSIRELFAKVKSIDAKHGKFELVLCVGDFFGPEDDESHSKDVDDLLNGSIDVPMPCYVMQGDHPVPPSVIQKYANSGSEICHNVFLLSKSSLLTTSQGLRIACLGGMYDEGVYSSTETPLGFSDPYFSSQTVEKLLSNISTTTSTSSSKGNANSNSLASLLKTSTSSHLIDIFVSQVWPASITKFSNSSPTSIEVNHAVSYVDEIVRKAKPKYHFATGSGSPAQFWEREPFVWDDENERVTRFVSLGAFGGDHGSAKKPRWFYAFSITPPSVATTQARPTNATTNPFTSTIYSGATPGKRTVDMAEAENFIFGAIQQPVAKRPKYDKESGKPPPGYKCRICESPEHFITDCPERSKPPEGYICKICKNPGHFIRDCPEKNATGDTGGRRPPPGYVCRACASEGHLIQDCPVAAQSRREREPRGKNRGPVKEIGPDECWFCLSNPSVAKHLLVAIGTECYVTLPKGPIIPTGPHADSELSKVPGGGHVLIVPITHYPTLTAMPPDLAIPIIGELEQHKSALRSLYAKHGCACVAFEVGILTGKGGHAHVQVCPIPMRLGNRVEGVFKSEGALAGVKFEDDPDTALEACAGGRQNYFRVDLPDGRKLVHLIKQEVPFSIQFGRQVLCKLLDVPGRLDWKACAQSESEERADAQAFKIAFAPFDTTQS